MTDFGLSENAKSIFKTLYCFEKETITDCFKRVSKEFSKTPEDEKTTLDLLSKNIWRPNTPVFFSSGTKRKVFQACFVMALEDSMDSIYGIANICRKVFQHGAGVGIPIGNLREKNAFIYEGDRESMPYGKSSGAIEFMKLYDAIAETTKSGGRTRRAAIMMVMPVWHPDIMDFISCKESDGKLRNMNISVAITDKFLQALKDNTPFQLITPSSGEPVGEVNPVELWDKLVNMAWKTADPGVFFIDTVNEAFPLKKEFIIQSSNPCGEQFLPPNSSCNLSSINISKFVEGKNINFDLLYQTSYKITELMDNLIDSMDYPDVCFKESTEKYRPVGIGIMGLSDAFYLLDLSYDTKEARDLGQKIMLTITKSSVECSADMAKSRGKFHDYDKFKEDTEIIITKLVGNDEKIIAKVRKNGLRNFQHTCIAPTGTISLSCDCSYGMEPCFGLVFQKNLMTGEKMHIINPVFKKRYENEDWYKDGILEKIIANNGSLKGLRGVPKDVRDVFIVAHDIKPKDRIDMQAALQVHCSNAISSTINLPATSTPEEISQLYLYAYEKDLKGVTIYRNGSKRDQPISFSKDNTQVKSNFTRPSKLGGNIHTMETGNGKMYVTVASHNNKPIEVFISMGKSGQLFNVFSEALGRTISIALQHGIPVEQIVRTLKNINSDRPTWVRFEETDKKPIQILSVPDGIAKLLERYYTGTGNGHDETSGEFCEKCGTYSVILVEGCAICQNCGESKCN
jgi:ribonucleoside-diphosphate reductase alpha chain